jgi:outer membrane protein
MRRGSRPEWREAGAMRGRAVATLLALVGLGAAAGPAAAQVDEVDRDPPVLTLQEAVERATRHNPAYRRTTNDLVRNQLDHREAWLGLLPTANVTLLRTGQNWSKTSVFENLDGTPEDRPDAGTLHTSDSQQGVNLSLQLDFSRYLDLRQQEDQAQLRELTVDTEFVGLRGDVVGAYLDAQEEQVAVELEEELLAGSRRNLEATRRLHGLAQVDRTEVLSAELEVAEREAELESRQARHRTTLLRLRNLIGDPDLEDFRLDPEPLATFDPAQLDEEAIVEEALRSSPRIRQAEGELRVHERNVSRNRAFWLPTLSVNAGTTRRRFLEGGDAFLDPLPDANVSWNVSFFLSLPNLGQYFQNHVDRERSRLDVRNQRETLREQRGEVEQDVRSSLVELRSAHRSMALQERRAELAEENLALTLDAYRLGRRTFLELQTASEQAAQARRAALQARFDFQRARVTLERALGMSLERFLPDGD